MKSLLPLFNEFRAMGEDKPYELNTDNMYVEPVEEKEIKSASGLIVPTTEQKFGTVESSRPLFIRVLDTGPGYDDPDNSDGDKIPLDIKPGDVLLVGENSSINWFTTFLGMPCGAYNIGFCTAEQSFGRHNNLDKMHEMLSNYIQDNK